MTELITREWFEGEILPEHSNIEIRQVSAWLHKGSEFVVISKDEKKWTIPGGHPEKGETTRESLNREIMEESGIDISNLDVKQLGYYYIVESNEGVQETILQLRFIVDLGDMDISNAKPSEHDKVDFSKLVPVSDIPNYVKWALDAKDFQLVRYQFDN